MAIGDMIDISTAGGLTNAIKKLYKDSMYEVLTYKKRPLLGMLPKFEGFFGSTLDIPIKLANTQGIAGNGLFSRARANAAQAAFGKFALTRASCYSIAGIEGEAIEASASKLGSFVRGLKDTLDGAWKSAADVMETMLYRNGDGSIGVVASVSTDTVTLVNRADIYNFEVGQHHAFAPTSVLTQVVDNGSSETSACSAVDRSAGTFITAMASDNASTTNKYIFISGFEYNTIAASGSYKTFRGLDAWLPQTAPSPSESFFGQDRSTESRMFGAIVDGTSGSIVENLIDASNEAELQGGEPEVYLCNTIQKRRIMKELQDKHNYNHVNARTKFGMHASISFKGASLETDSGEVTIIGTPKCPITKSWMLDLSTLKLNTLYGAPRFLDHDGVGKILRAVDDDAYECRVGARGNVSCNAPGWNASLSLTDIS